MAHACPPLPQEPGHPSREHPATALLAVLAVLLAIVLISWAALELQGAPALRAVVEAATNGHPPRVDARTDEEREVDHAVTSSRFATGLSP